MKKPQPKQILDVQRPTKKKKSPVPRAAIEPSRPLHTHPFVVPVVTFLVLFFVSMAGYVVLNGQTIGASDSHVIKVSVNGDVQAVPTRAKTVKEFMSRAKIDINEGDVIEPDLDTPITDDDFRVNVYRARPVTVIDGDKRIQTLSAAKTPRSVASQAGIKIYPEDGVEASRPAEQILKDGVLGEKVVIDRATPTHLNLYGTKVTVRTRARNVADLLKEKQVKLAKDDTITPSLDTKLKPNTQVFVTRNGVQIISSEEEIAMPIETIEDVSLSFGATAVRQQGSPGKKVVTYQIETKNGREVSRKAIQEIIATEPVKQVVARGRAFSIPDDKSGLLAAAGIPQSDYPYVNHIISRESGWCATKWQGQIGYCPGYYSEIHSPSSGYGYGLCQATPAGKMASAGGDWASSAVTQLRWCSGYANGRYGSWEAAYNFWLNNHWW